MVAKGKKKYNLHLTQENAELLRKYLKGTGMTLSNYVDALFAISIENLKMAKIKPGDSVDAFQFLKLLNMEELHVNHTDQALEDLMDRDPELALKLIKEYKLGFSDRYYERKERERKLEKE